MPNGLSHAKLLLGKLRQARVHDMTFKVMLEFECAPDFPLDAG